MKRVCPLILLSFASVLSAQIVIRDVGRIVDAASYTEGIAQGSLFVVKGGSFPIEQGINMSPLPLQQTLKGVSIVFSPTTGGETFKPYMLYTYAGSGGIQLAAVLPSATPPGNYKVSVVTGSTTVTGGTAWVVERKFRSLTNNQQGFSLAVVQNHVNSARLDRNMFVAGRLSDGQTRSPAVPGQTVILWGLGLGAIRGPDNDAPGAIDLREQLDVTVAVGGIDAPVQYAGRSPQFPGLDQINFTIPADAPTGCNVALQVLVKGEASNPVTLAIAPTGKDACEDAWLSRAHLESLDNGETLAAGGFNLMRYIEPAASAGGRMVEIHSAVGSFSALTASNFAGVDIRSIAPGRCVLFGGDAESVGLLDVGAGDSLDAGRMTVSGPQLPNVALDGDDDWYYKLFSARLEESGATIAGNLAHLLAPGVHTLRGPGGSAVGPVEAALQLPELLNWMNRDALREVNRDSGLRVDWTGGGANSHIVVQGGAVRMVSSTQAEATVFYCAVPPDSQSFTVPAETLRLIPPTTSSSAGILSVAAFSGNSSTRFDTTVPNGVRLGYARFGYLMMTTRLIAYR